MEDVLDPLVSRGDEEQGSRSGPAWQLIQALVVSISRAFDAQQCFVTAFTDSQSYPSNIITEWSLEDASAFLTSLPSTSFFLGSAVGAFLLTPLADSRLGRKNVLLLSCLIMSISGLLTSFFATNLFVYAVLRFLSGIGRSSLGSCTLALCTELIGPRWRSHVGILTFVFFCFGFASLPAIAYLNRDFSWRRIFFWTSLPAFLYSFLVYFFVRESSRWLSLHTKTATICSSMKTLFSRKWARRRLFFVMVMSFGIGVAYYGMPLGLGNLSFNLYLSVAMEALFELPAAFAAFCLVGTLNRKSSLLVTMTVSGICSIACGAATGSSSALQLVLELAGFVSGCTAFDLGLIYVSELFPTCVRNSAFAMAMQAVVLGGVVGAVLAAVGEAQHNELIAYGGFGVVILVCAVFVMWLPETKGTEFCDTMEQEECKVASPVLGWFV